MHGGEESRMDRNGGNAFAFWNAPVEALHESHLRLLHDMQANDLFTALNDGEF